MHKFENREVIATKVAITGAGDGLSKAMAVEPEELSLGRTVYVVLECTVAKITHQEATEADGLVRIQNLRAGTATIVEKTLVSEVLDAQRAKIDEALGRQALDFTGEGKEGGEGVSE